MHSVVCVVGATAAVFSDLKEDEDDEEETQLTTDDDDQIIIYLAAIVFRHSHHLSRSLITIFAQLSERRQFCLTNHRESME